MIARVKYHRQAIPMEYEFPTEEQARRFCELKEAHNPYVRWTEVGFQREFPNQPLGNSDPIAKEILQTK